MDFVGPATWCPLAAAFHVHQTSSVDWLTMLSHDAELAIRKLISLQVPKVA